jgi:four helix bundle protein
MMKTYIKFDLEDRTSMLGRDVISFLSKIQRSPITAPLIAQLIRSATSVGANYFEANNAFSRADFKHKLSICRKEARESVYWLDMFLSIDNCNKALARDLSKEAHELNLIFNSIIQKVEKNDKINKLTIT